MDVRGGVCSACQSLFFFLLIRHDREVATHSSCSAKSSHFVRDTGARVEGWHDLLTSTMVPTKSSSAWVHLARRIEPNLSHLPLHQMDEQVHLRGHLSLLDHTGTSATASRGKRLYSKWNWRASSDNLVFAASDRNMPSFSRVW